MDSPALIEFRDVWLPNATRSGIERLALLLEQGSPYLIHGAFANACARGCLASHVAWHHPATEHLHEEAGVRWLAQVAGLNPATSQVILAWDRAGASNWELRNDLLAASREALQQCDLEDEMEYEESAELCWS